MEMIYDCLFYFQLLEDKYSNGAFIGNIPVPTYIKY